ncbi:hypothetical protein QTJ16_001059 [Diplocarpon rosae]|uniref:Uncharacterized protein n=1 Tax=Diplocarpon rosae TaxID=946125 RepID=A0AAD9T7H2_9HELO|nr:hypothetical protein QTJ16_001059 [Diplocarpon rosae]
MSPDVDINVLKDENASLRGALTRAEKKLSEQSGNVVQLASILFTVTKYIVVISSRLHARKSFQFLPTCTPRLTVQSSRLQVDSKISRRTLRTQGVQLSNLRGPVASKEKIIQSQAEQVQKLTAAPQIPPTYLNPLAIVLELQSKIKFPLNTATESKSGDSVQDKDEQIKTLKERLLEADEDLDTLMRTMMPCYQVGFQIRQRNRDADLARRDKKNPLIHADAICDCAAADPLSDASIFLFDQNVHSIISPDAEYWAHYEYSYGAPPDVVLDKCRFGSFLNLLTSYRNMQRYAEEGSTPKLEATAFLNTTRQLIDQVHPFGVLDCDQDFQKDQKLYEVYQHVRLEYARASARHKAFLGDLADCEDR